MRLCDCAIRRMPERVGTCTADDPLRVASARPVRRGRLRVERWAEKHHLVQDGGCREETNVRITVNGNLTRMQRREIDVEKVARENGRII